MARVDRDLIKQLAGLPVLDDCSAADRKALAAVGHDVGVPAAWTIVHEGTPADAVYLLLEGSATVRVHGQAVQTISAGAIVGELGLFDRRLRSASIVADGHLRALRVEYADLARLLVHHPALAAVFQAAAQAHHDADQAASTT